MLTIVLIAVAALFAIAMPIEAYYERDWPRFTAPKFAVVCGLLLAWLLI